MKVFVTGGSGYIGSVVVKDLLTNGHEVTVFDNLERGHRDNVDSRAKLMVGDLRDAGEIMSALSDERPDAVIHFAAYALVGESMSDPMKYWDNNVKGGINLLEAMTSAGCSRIIFSSSCATYGVPSSLPIEENMPQCPTNPYGHSKLMFEQMCKWLEDQKGLQPTFLRYFNAAGAAYGMAERHDPETHIIPNVLKVATGEKDFVEVFGTDYPTSDGTCIRDYVHVKDLSSAHILALEKNVLGAFNLSAGKGVSVREVIEASRRITGRDIPVKTSPRRMGDPPCLYATGSNAQHYLGWVPRCSDIDTIISDAWQCHKKLA